MKAKPPNLTHLDPHGRPAMVDISAKPATAREALAECRVRFPAEVAAQLRASGLKSKKGGIVDTAIVAGTMAVKRTHELIPFCHPLGLEDCQVFIELEGDDALIRCEASVHGRTGVEMEALTGASVAALTVYDMCKSLSKGIVIGDTRLVEKTGGKSDFRRAG